MCMQAYLSRMDLDEDACGHVKRHIGNVMDEQYTRCLECFRSRHPKVAARCSQVCPYTLEQLCNPDQIADPAEIVSTQ